jgi:hypothetical protein
MRYIIISLILFYLTSIIHTNGQESRSIDSTSQWICNEIYISPGTSYEEVYFKISIKYDTLINDTIYYTLYENGENHYSYRSGFKGVYYIINRYIGAITTSNNNILIVFPKDSISQVLYDFKYNPNDTITSIVGEGLIILKIDTMMDGRKKLITNQPGFFIIEGIGSSSGLFETNSSYMVKYPQESILGCYYQNNKLIFINDSSICNFHHSQVSDKEHDTQDIEIYPNPVVSKLIINSKMVLLKNIEIYNSNGILLKSQEVRENYYSLDISFFNSGIYFIRINDLFIYKLIKN